MHETGGVRTDVAESLDDDAGAFPLQVQALQGFVGDDHDAASGGFTTAFGSAHVFRLAGDDSRDRLAHVHGIGIHDPRHGLLVGVHVGSGNIFFRPDEFEQLSGVAARHTFEFAARHFLGIADDAALGSAKWNVDDSALPRHPAGECADFVESNVRAIADAAFGRSASDGMLDTVAGENFQLAIVELDRDMNDDLPVGIAENLP